MWEISMVLMVRSLIGDLDSAKYTDSRIKQLLVVGAYNVENDADFSINYTIDVAGVSISPDPVSINDKEFVALTVYKTASIILGSEVKSESANAISIKDGPSAMDLRGVSAKLMDLYDRITQQYEQMLEHYQYNNSIGEAILGPYSPGSWGVRGGDYYSYYYGWGGRNVF
jgi:hypothetical protein